MPEHPAQFSGAVPDVYDRYLVPLIFSGYAADLAARAAEAITKGPEDARVLETAAGTGVVTAALDTALPGGVGILATDLSPAMLETARRRNLSGRVGWATADATDLPMADGAFGAVVCQFGAMFFPDRVTGFAEARRVLTPGGTFLFNVWDRIEASPVAYAVHRALGALFPDDPPTFMQTGPHGYNDPDRIRADVAAAGYGDIRIEGLSLMSVAPSAREAALAYCQGTPLRPLIEARAPGALDKVTDDVHEALLREFGSGPVATPIRAYVIEAR